MRLFLAKSVSVAYAAVLASACGGADSRVTSSAANTGGVPNGTTGGGSNVDVSSGGRSTALTGGNANVGGAAIGGSSSAVGGAQTTGGRATGGAALGGAVATGGTPSPTGGTLATGGSRTNGGASTTGGNKATGGSSQGGTTGQLTPQQAAKLMAPGWNLGNSFDSNPNETSWGNPTPSQTLINAVHSAGFKTLRLPVTWTDHIGAAPSYTIDAAWLNKVTQTAQWAIDAGMYVFVNTHHEADGNGGWVTFPTTTAAAASVVAEVTAVWAQIATAFKSFTSRLMLECFNEPNYAGSNNAQTQADLNLYLEACYSAIRGTGGANSTRTVMIQPIGASPIQSGIQAMQKVSFINDPNLVISLHTYYPTNFGLSTTPYAWGSSADYTSMQNSIAQQIRVWLPTQVIFIGEWGSMAAQATTNRAAHALAYSQDTTTANIVPLWWDNGGSGTSSFSLFDRSSGAVTQTTIVNGIMTGVKNGLLAPNTWATLANP